MFSSSQIKRETSPTGCYLEKDLCGNELGVYSNCLIYIIMTFEDVDFLKNNSTEESYIFYSDSRNRNKNLYPNSEKYRIDFTSPFQNVFAFDVLDASIPRTQYAVDTHNNSLVVGFGLTYQQNAEKLVTVEPKDYTLAYLLEALNEAFLSNGINIRVVPYSEPAELTNRIVFRSNNTFYINLLESTMNEVLGFDQMPTESSYKEYTVTKNDSTHTIHSILFEANPGFASGGVQSNNIQFDTFEAYSSRLLSVDDSLEIEFTDTITLMQDIFISPENDGIYEDLTSICIYLAEPLPLNVTKPEISVTLILDNQTVDNSYEKMAFHHNAETVSYDFDKILVTIPDADTKRLVPGNYILLLRFKSTKSDGGASQTLKFNVSPINGGLFQKNTTGGSATQDIFSDDTTLIDGYSLVEDFSLIEGMLMITIEAREHYVYTLIPKGITNLTGDQYCVLRCPEIEQHMHRNKGFESFTMGIAKFNLRTLGYDNTRFDFASIPMRKFHPIGKLPSITLEFYGPTGTLYNFRGVNHSITFVLRYYIPTIQTFNKYILNPDYNPDFFKYIQQQESSDSDTE